MAPSVTELYGAVTAHRHDTYEKGEDIDVARALDEMSVSLGERLETGTIPYSHSFFAEQNDEKKEELEWKALEKFLTYNILLPKEYPFVFTPQNIIVEKINNQKLRDKWMEESWYMVRDIVEKGLRERCDKYRYLQAFSVNGEELEASLLGQSIRRNIEVLEDKGIVKRIGEDGLFDLDHLLLTAKRFPLIVVHQSGLVYFLLCYDMNIPNIYEDKREDSFFKVVENIYKIQERMKTEKSSTLGTKVERPKQPEESRDTLNPYDLNNVQKVNRE